MIKFKPGKKPCKNDGCELMFEKNPFQPFQMCCSIKCSLEYNKKKEAKKQKEETAKENKEWRDKKRSMKEGLLSYSDWLKRLEQEINAIARRIDYELPCISCRRFGKPQAGHYHSVGSDATIRYNLHNIHIQDYYCNVKKSANIIGYDAGLIRIYGQDYWEYVKFKLKAENTKGIHLSIPEIKVLILKSKEILKGIELVKRTPEERLKTRDNINKELAIYNKHYFN